jgi:hypothetical protein
LAGFISQFFLKGSKYKKNPAEQAALVAIPEILARH